MNDSRRAVLLMLTFVALWALVEVLAAGVLLRYSPFQVVWTRYGIHLLLMLAVWGWHRPDLLVRTSRPVFQLARSLLMLGMPASWIFGMRTDMPMGMFMTVFWLSPLLIIALARLVLGEHAPPSLWFPALVGFAGSLVLHDPARLENLRLLAYPIGMALSFSLYVVMTRTLRREDVRANLFYTALGVFIALSPAVPTFWTWPGVTDFMAMAAVGVLGFFALFALDRMASADRVSVSAPFAYLQIAFLIALATLAGMELDHTKARTFAGLALILLAAAFAWLRLPQGADETMAGAGAHRVSKES
jgi:drug/metabolite transporter (DMT)-like permease